MGCLLELLIKIRSNDYVVISDVKQAFLMIKLAKCEDRNKFSILWQDDRGKLVAYRYKSLVFGFASSPFILNHVIKHHVSKYPMDECSNILLNNLYVDNLFFTGGDIDELLTLYRESSSRMGEGGFELRSWASNSSELMAHFQADECAVQHASDHERVLGYRYFPAENSLGLSEQPLSDLETVSKRSVLSHLAII